MKPGDYLEYDEFGLKSVKCMRCGTEVAGRSYVEVPSKTEVGKMEKALTFKQYSNYRQAKLEMYDKDGKYHSYIEPIVCAGCEKEDLDCHGILNHVIEGLDKAMVSAGRSHNDRAKNRKDFEGMSIKKGRTK